MPTRRNVTSLRDIPNVGPATVADLVLLGITTPAQLVGRDPFALYDELCARTGVRHDPCVYDVLISAVRYMEGAPSRPWWKYTAERKRILNARSEATRSGVTESERG
jgi:Pathogenicity locus